MKYTIINTAGQWTPIITGDYSAKERIAIGKDLLSTYAKAGQVAFINKANQVNMMGGELSINGSIAAGYHLAKTNNQKSIDLIIGKSNLNIPISIDRNNVTASFKSESLVKVVKNNSVWLNGIAYTIINCQPDLNNLSYKQLNIVQKLSNNCPAVGIIFYQNNRIWPVIYVKAANTLIWETACGSGSLAYYLITNTTDVIQPSNQVIRIKESNDTLSVIVAVKEIIP